MKNAQVVNLPSGTARYRRVARVADVRQAARRGRVWVNGREVGGTDPRYAHLATSYD
jgi:hypothetical protein